MYVCMYLHIECKYLFVQSVHQGWFINSVDHCVLRLVILLEHLIVMVDVLKDVSVLMDKLHIMKNVFIPLPVQVSAFVCTHT